jgi:hypothetical protein
MEFISTSSIDGLPFIGTVQHRAYTKCDMLGRKITIPFRAVIPESIHRNNAVDTDGENHVANLKKEITSKSKT